ncbi:hypothetical protein N7495_000817 [Penicillium taxi]|uniref:uncharacterized protein n=1 Tax=Penicillium taxi TaxID=168475 RepID=UPI0025459F54|nr:uncharacterized protein N7495_000817 [Penicillium taxi]KAJ5908135.1 hypothetical protein N7495_000817 [Penicillium taxi]
MPRFPKDTGFQTSEHKPEDVKNPSVQSKNRRRRYLDLHPEYFSAELELADPLLYDRLIRRFLTPQEREAQGRERGFSGVLQADLMRSEAKMEALAQPDPRSMFSYTRGPNGEILAEDRDDIPSSKEEGQKRWQWEMSLRFIRGDDSDFEYKTVDQNDEYDDWSMHQDKYFDEEEPEVDEDSQLEGETGIQDF